MPEIVTTVVQKLSDWNGSGIMPFNFEQNWTITGQNFFRKLVSDNNCE